VKGWSVVIPPVASAGGFGAALAIGAAAGHVIRAEPLASLPAEAVVASLAPVLQRLLSSDRKLRQNVKMPKAALERGSQA